MEQQNTGKENDAMSKNILLKVSLDESMDISRAVGLKMELQKALLHKAGVHLDMSKLERIDAAIIQLLMVFANDAKLTELRLEWDRNCEVFNRAVERLDVTEYFFQSAA